MEKITPEYIYDNIYFFAYGMHGYEKKDCKVLRKFVNDLMNLDIRRVAPFDEFDTMIIRSLYYLVPTVPNHNADLIDLLRRLIDYIYEEEHIKTRD